LGLDAEGLSDTAAAFERLRAAAQAGKPYRMAFLDCRLDGENGSGFALQFQKEGRGSLPSLILLTTYAERSQMRQGSPSFGGYLAKPFRHSALKDCLAALFAPSWQGVNGHDVLQSASLSPVTGPDKKAEIPRNSLTPADGGLHSSSRGRLLLAEDNAVNQRV